MSDGVVSSKLLSLHVQRQPYASSVAPEKSRARASNEASAAQGKDDRVSLSRGATVAEIQQVLTSKLSEQLAARFEAAGISLEQARGLDMSAEATSSRIAGFATGLFDTFASQNPELAGNDLVDRFASVVHAAVSEGYSEALTALDGMGLAEDEGLLSTAQETMDLVHAKLEAFFARMRGEDASELEAVREAEKQ